jgi:hypothetical protein
LSDQALSGNCYVTHFDSGYAAFGLAMLRSLCTFDETSQVLVVGMDSRVRDIVNNDPVLSGRVAVVELDDLERSFPVLPGLRADRTWREYCWTLTPFLLLNALNRGAAMATYVDADLYFFSSPVPFLRELQNGSRHIVLTDHDYLDDRDLSAESGRFCVQFLPVRNTEEGLAFVHWWRDLCIESCSEVATAEVFGDQKYLDRAPFVFGDSVGVESGHGRFLGPWNARRTRRSDVLPIAFHFHGLRAVSGRIIVRSGEWRLGASRRLYRQYEKSLARILHEDRRLRIPPTSLSPRVAAVLAIRRFPVGVLPRPSARVVS